MILISSLLALAVQVGPDPTQGGLQGIPEELLDRPPRPQEQDTPQSPESAWLAECLTMLEQDAARAHTQAQVRRAETTGTARVLANHCLGLAATRLTLWDDAITAFESARDETPEDEERTRSRFGTMAGNAALASGDTPRAVGILQRAKNDAQASASATLQALAAIDLGRALVAMQRPEESLTELEAATTLAPENAEGWLLSATLLRRLGRLDDAQIAIERASALAPMDAQVGLEAGVIAVLSGRDEAARASWQSVIDIQPDSRAAQIAGDYIAQLGPTPDASPPAVEEEPS